MKHVLSVVFQFILYLVVFGVGSLLPAFGTLPMWSFSTSPGRIFVYDGLVLTLLVYLAVLLIAAARKRLPVAIANASTALVLALVVGLLMKFGFKTV